MGRKKITNSINETVASLASSIIGNTERNYKIRDAAMKDGICNYSYEIIKGVGYGDVHSVKGTALYLPDLGEAFALFNAHLAFIDDAFKHAQIEVTDIDTMHNDDLTFLYTVTGFQIKGSEENEGIVLVGMKHVSNGRIDIKTPKIMLDSASSYKWYNELKTAADKARNEVALYKEGKCEVVEEAIEPDKSQLGIFDMPGLKVSITSSDFDQDFAEAAR